MAEDRETNLFIAKIAEQAERYEEMVDAIKKVAASDGELNSDERNLLSVAFKNVIGTRRASLRIVHSIEAKEESKGNEKHVEQIRDYKQRINKELEDICSDVHNVLDNHLIPKATDQEAKVFYYKMKADYYRYMAEFASGDKKKEASEKALGAYESAKEHASDLAPTHPMRLGLALNMSVFYYEIMNQPDKACQLAKDSFDQAIAETSTMDEDTFKDATLIMQLLRDNLTLWTNAEENADE